MTRTGATRTTAPAWLGWLPARIAASIVATLGIAVIVGWVFGIAELQPGRLGAATMKFNTALCFTMAGLSVWLASFERPKNLDRILAASVGVIAALTAMEFALDVDLGIDQLFVRDLVTPAELSPGRMSLVSAANFALVALTLLAPRSGTSRWTVGLGTKVPMVGLLVSMTAVMGYLFGTPVLYQPAAWISIASHTALSFAVLFIGLLTIRTDVGPLSLMTSAGAGGVLARRILPVLIGLPTLLGWLFATFEPLGSERGRLELAVFTVAVMLTLAFVLWSAGTRANALDDDLRRTLASLEASEAQIREAEERYRSVVNLIPIGIWIERDGAIAYANPYLAHLVGDQPPASLLGKEGITLFAEHDRQQAASYRSGRADPEARWFRTPSFELHNSDGDKALVELMAIDYPHREPGQVMYLCRDVTAQREAEAQLRHAQKMESVGQLTGGIAHDFNNLLTIVIGNLELAMEDSPSAGRERVTGALHAAERAAVLTHRLLAFARQQPLDPGPIHVNRLISGMAGLFRRTLGPTIEIDVRAQDPLPAAYADAGQLENVLLNLVINARDAMPRGGRVTIETQAVHLDEEYAARNAEVESNDYIMLSVSDTGTGMAPEVIEHAFEPFFTTKETGKGTGLGLSMAYGFAKQSRGHLKIYSELGFGTTIRLYLPYADADAPAAAQPTPPTFKASRAEATILLVEDQDDVRAVAERQLRFLGYSVLVASNATEARQILASEAKVDLLFSDVVMPGGVTGRDLVVEARAMRPGIRTLLASGYSRSSIEGTQPLDPGVVFLSKPYRLHDLAAKVDKALGGEGRGDAR